MQAEPQHEHGLRQVVVRIGGDVRQTEYEYLWVLGAVCPETGHAEELLSPRVNTDVINVFLREFSATLASDEHAVMIWDGAGFHTSNAF